MLSEHKPQHVGGTVVPRICALTLDFARMMVNHPASVSIQSAATDTGVSLTLRIAEVDLYRFIGHKGRTVSALRTVLAAIGAKERMTIKLTVEAIE